jgi:hypothetical protein
MASPQALALRQAPQHFVFFASAAILQKAGSTCTHW